MSAGSTAAAGQRLAEALMTLTLTAYEPAEPTMDADGAEVPLYSAQGSTSGKVQGASGKDTATRTVRVGEIDRPVLDAGLHIPLTVFGNGTDVVASEQRGYPGGAWELVVTAVGSLDDAGLLGRRYMVVGCPAKSYATARRLDVVEVPAP